MAMPPDLQAIMPFLLMSFLLVSTGHAQGSGCNVPNGAMTTKDCCKTGTCTHGCNDITLSCKPALVGNDVTGVTCNNGTFSDTPTCRAGSRCNVPNKTTTTEDCCKTGTCTHGCKDITLSCKPAFVGNDVLGVTCNDGTFSDTPTCRVAEGCTFASGDNINPSVEVSNTIGTISIGSGIPVKCSPGYYEHYGAPVCECIANETAQIITDCCGKLHCVWEQAIFGLFFCLLVIGIVVAIVYSRR